MLKRLAVTVGDGAGDGAGEGAEAGARDEAGYGAGDEAGDGAGDVAEAGAQLSRIWPALDTCHAGQLFNTCNEK